MTTEWMAAGAVFLFLSTVVFVDGVEVLSSRLGLTRFATGALLAAVLTALPETVIAILSPIHGDAEAMLVGMGSVLAAPSITLLLAGPVALLFWRGNGVGRLVARNYLVFAVFIAVAVGFALWGLGVYRYVLGLLFLLSYVLLARSMLFEEGELMESHGNSFLERLAKRRSTPLLLTQVGLSSAGLLAGADVFIDAALRFANPFVISLLVSPFATCLQEVLMAFYWVFRRKADIAVSLLSGENLIQATFVAGVGMIFTEWSLPSSAAAVAAIYVLAAMLLTVFLYSGRTRPVAAVLILYPLYIVTAG
ncbi:MAG: hypothetical protein NZ581_00550 [Candidatus Caldarchaeum sp.]|nr:hypothetical protein [Candidatus Caldarchaeum sp.]MDW8434677.1 hypothetical protein [Candidatus Caldarchaeum sp.]